MELNPIKKLTAFYDDSKHVMSVSQRPDITAFERTLKIVLIGVLTLGILGFIISLVILFIAH
jgi:protein translocase SEC61 complex gamma subunit